MSATKRDSPDGCGGDMLAIDRNYEAWLDSLPSISDEDLEAMAAQDYEMRHREDNEQS